MTIRCTERGLKYGAMILIMAMIIFWTYLLVDVYLEWVPSTFLLSSSSSSSSSSLTASKTLSPPFAYIVESEDVYHKAIPGLLYNESIAEIAEEPSEPSYFPLGQLLRDWPPDNTQPKGWLHSRAHPRYGHSIARFDYSTPSQKLIAQRFREAELPFVLYNVPELVNASAKFSLSDLLANFGEQPRLVERSKSNHFMYYKMKNENQLRKKFPEWTPPQDDVPITFGKYVEQASLADTYTDAPDNHPLYYMTISASEGYDTPWIASAFPSFTDKKSFFIIDPEEFNGINCRFGMRGVIAEAHYDGHRNFVAMVRGRKRYVLQPPSECSKLHLLPKGHPSGRHSSIDWSSMDQLRALENSGDPFLTARSTEVVLSMGEMLYIPSFWFHYIVSQDASIQCNSRSGRSMPGGHDIIACGFG